MANFTPGPWHRNGRFAIESQDKWVVSVDTDANANLISAAPELYCVLCQIIDYLPVKRDWLDPDIERIARAALKKAEGRQ